MKRVLLLFISEHSGHHCASIAIEKALCELDPSTQTLNINSFNYTNPILEKIINKAYMGVVKRTPEIWDYLYDNPKVLKKTQSLRDMIHRFNTGKLKVLLDDFKPDAIVCTQAFPCGMIADYKKSFALDTPLIAVLTDYAPHSYWVYNNVDQYIVPSKETGNKLIANGIDPARIKDYGIPIEAKFRKSFDKAVLREKLGMDKDTPCLLIMGGTQGLGPIKELVRIIDRSKRRLQLVIACGTNKKLYNSLKNRKFQNKVTVHPYADNIDELMEASDVILTKPGGITTAEALAKGLPMLIISPLPGQEAMNTKILLKEEVAVKAESPEDVAILLDELLESKNKLKAMSDRARALAKPDSAIRIAKLILEIA
ncbi:MAG: glycosyltransferase [Candidatus Omnitrophica bacterium]|nr:glycosyltransferase [Candidatus Omnitrophota bacterium]